MPGLIHREDEDHVAGRRKRVVELRLVVAVGGPQPPLRGQLQVVDVVALHDEEAGMKRHRSNTR